MAIEYADRIKETTTTTGTGTLNLVGAVAGFQTFVSGIGSTKQTVYVIDDGTSWEIGEGTITSGSPDTLSRDTVLSSSTGAKINWGAGTKVVSATNSASRMNSFELIKDAITGDLSLDATFNGNIIIAGNVDGRDVSVDGTKLDGIETAAKDDQTGAEIKTLYEAEVSAFTDAQFTKLAGIDTGAKDDQTGAEIKALYELETNAFTDGQFTKLAGIETAAKDDQVASEVPFTPAGSIAASDVQAALEEVDTEKLALAGGIMTGDITLNADPTNVFHATTKQYVDAQITASEASLTTDNLRQDDGTATGGSLIIDGVNIIDSENYFVVTNASMGNSPEIRVDGSWSDIDLSITAKGAGIVRIKPDLIVDGSLTVNGSTTTVNTTNTTITDSLLELANGTTGVPTNDSGMVVERGSLDNVFWGWDEATDSFTVGTGTFTGSSTGALSTTDANARFANITGTLTTAAQPNITSVGTLVGLVLNADPSVALGAATKQYVDTTAGSVNTEDLLGAPGIPGTGLIIVDGVTTADAVNYVEIANAIVGVGPTITSEGTETNIDLNINAKGTGTIKADSDVYVNDELLATVNKVLALTIALG